MAWFFWAAYCNWLTNRFNIIRTIKVHWPYLPKADLHFRINFHATHCLKIPDSELPFKTPLDLTKKLFSDIRFNYCQFNLFKHFTVYAKIIYYLKFRLLTKSFSKFKFRKKNVWVKRWRHLLKRGYARFTSFTKFWIHSNTCPLEFTSHLTSFVESEITFILQQKIVLTRPFTLKLSIFKTFFFQQKKK